MAVINNIALCTPEHSSDVHRRIGIILHDPSKSLWSIYRIVDTMDHATERRFYGSFGPPNRLPPQSRPKGAGSSSRASATPRTTSGSSAASGSPDGA